MARIGLVLGAGGSLGLAWHGAVLAAVEEVTGWDPRTADVVVGTSAGSLSGALLRAGLGGADLCAITEGRALSPAGADLAALGRPHRPRIRPADFLRLRLPGDLGGAVRGLARPWRAPLAVLAAALPAGPGSTASISDGLDAAAGGAWPDDPLWITAVRLADRRRVVFGRDAGVRPSLGTAVGASCAIPGFYRPVVFDRHRYVDGGVASVHHADLLAGPDAPDVVLVSAPMSYQGRRPPIAADSLLRQAVRAQLAGEVARLRRTGVEVVVLAPDRRVVAAMGLDAMNAARRGAVSRLTRRRLVDQLAAGDLALRLAGASTPRTPAA